jgi:hypothetical protein
MRQGERWGREKMLPIDREKLLRSVVLVVGHAPTLARPRERSKNEEASMPRRGAGAEQPNGKAAGPAGGFHWRERRRAILGRGCGPARNLRRPRIRRHCARCGNRRINLIFEPPPVSGRASQPAS